jgi:hypothetical protein
MSTENYPLPDKDNELEWRREVTRIRENDLGDFTDLPKIYVRKVSREPTSSNNIIEQDKIGDFSFVNGYLYVLLESSGIVKWQRVPLSDF